MSTTTGPDLTTAREAVEALMDDTCEIVRDSQGTSDDVLNTTTGALHPPSPDSSTVYDDTTLGEDGRELGGRCKVSIMSGLGSGSPRVETAGDIPYTQRFYSGSIPWDGPVIAEGDIFKVTSSRRDPELVDKEFVVREVAYSTFLVSRKMTLEKLP